MAYCENCFHADVCGNYEPKITKACKHFKDDYMINEALKKQIPIKPIIIFGEKHKTHNYGRLMSFFCPNCKMFILAMYETDVFRGGGISNDLKGCCTCLQRIDFNGYYKITAEKGDVDNAKV